MCDFSSLLNKLSFGRLLILEVSSLSHQPYFFCVLLKSWLVYCRQHTSGSGLHPTQIRTEWSQRSSVKCDARIKHDCYSSTLFRSLSKELSHMSISVRRKKRAGVLCRTSIICLCTHRSISHPWLTSANVSICRDGPQTWSCRKKSCKSGGEPIFAVTVFWRVFAFTAKHSEKHWNVCMNFAEWQQLYQTTIYQST